MRVEHIVSAIAKASTVLLFAVDHSLPAKTMLLLLHAGEVADCKVGV